MSVVYVKEQGAAVHKRGNRLLIEKDDVTLAEIPLRETTMVALFGNVQPSSQALGELAEHGIPVSFYTRNGRLRARVVPEASGSIEAKLRQYRAATHAETALPVAKALVCAKLANSRRLVEDYRKHYPSDGLAQAAESLKASAEGAFGAAAIDELMGFEGSGAAVYFRAFVEMNRSGFEFPGRRKHPSTDPLNALLSLGYTMAGNELHALVEGMGLEPYLGFLHAAEDNRPSLALDLVEPFRASFVDRLALRLVNERVLREEDFVKRAGGGMAGSVILRPEAWARYLEAYEEAIGVARAFAPAGIRGEMRDQVARLVRALRDGTEFVPYLEDVECDT